MNFIQTLPIELITKILLQHGEFDDYYNFVITNKYYYTELFLKFLHILHNEDKHYENKHNIGLNKFYIGIKCKFMLVLAERNEYANFIPKRYIKTILKISIICKMWNILDILLSPTSKYLARCRRIAMQYASRHGNIEFIKILINKYKIDPSIDRNYVIQEASKKGYIELVKLLLADDRVNPGDM